MTTFGSWDGEGVPGEMRLTAAFSGDLSQLLAEEVRAAETAVTAGVRQAGEGLKGELRRQVTGAGLGSRLANAWRDRHYPNEKVDAASLVWTKAPQIIRAFAEGVTIRSRRGRWLAIPTENAPRRGTDGKRISPSTFPEHRLGRLRLVARPGKHLQATRPSTVTWATLYRATSRPFPKPSTGRFAVKVINHLGDEVMKVFQV
jgi:hypothetical protein